jgi:hypothetical protein
MIASTARFETVQQAIERTRNRIVALSVSIRSVTDEEHEKKLKRVRRSLI